MWCSMWGMWCNEVNCCYYAESCQECSHCSGRYGTVNHNTHKVIYD